MNVKQRPKTGFIVCLVLLSIAEEWALHTQLWSLPDKPAALFLAKTLIPGIWALFLVFGNLVWGFRHMFTSGEFYFKRSEDTQLLPGAEGVFRAVYSIHILFSLCFGIWLIAGGQLHGIFWPAAKTAFVVCAYRQLFPLKTE